MLRYDCTEVMQLKNELFLVIPSMQKTLAACKQICLEMEEVNYAVSSVL